MTNTMKNVRVLAIAVAVLCAIAFMPLLSDSMQSHAASKLKVSKSSATITGYGKTVKITAKGLKAKELKKVTWTSSNPKIAKVNKKGKVGTIKAVYNGTATITAKYKKQTKKIKVTVNVENPSVTGNYQTEGTVYALLYQESAEVAAMQMQAFSLAKERLDDWLYEHEDDPDAEPAIITDIDSTIADDTCYIAGAVLDSAGRVALGMEPWNNDDWNGYYEAVATTADTVIPGAKQFVDYAYSQGVQFYYITNRPYYELDLTVQQLNNQGFFEKDPTVADGAGIVDTYKVAKDWQEYYYCQDEQLTVPVIDEETGENISYDPTGPYSEAINATGVMEIAYGSYSVKDDYRVQVQGTGFDSDKADRRANVFKTVGRENVVMYMGDSINDMVSDGEKAIWGDKTKDFTRKQFNDTRTANASDPYWAGDWGKDQSIPEDVDEYNPGHWGYDFIVLPNATYGDWYKATWAKNKKDEETGINSKTRAGQQKYIYNQIWAHSYKNTDLFQKWYEGPSPVDSYTQ